uniref:Uncharacterized protein n=1 Tax=Rhizophagus irregularis (strain DAOM 181602 / DAOM 197198 / MUCL 43194) TaxID=747089 RepID=U9U364_RHIID
MVTRDGRKFTCDFYFVTKLIVDDLSNEKYQLIMECEKLVKHKINMYKSAMCMFISILLQILGMECKKN